MPLICKVSVVVPVYNPGPNIDGLIVSLDRQTLAAGELEVLFVDDGSTDGTRERLDQAVAGRDGFSVTTIPSSGWPGRPRNVGTDLARGEFVFYADHDDEIFPEALEQMYAMAVADRCDIVYGKVVRVGLSTPYWQLAKTDTHHADIVDDRLLFSRSTHKLYRRKFLVENDIRFPEGPVRLEDHHFMGQALSHRPEVSILASEPCYRWIHRPDGTNSSSQPVDLAEYFDFFTASVQLLQTDEVEERVREEIAVVSAERLFLAVRPDIWSELDGAGRKDTTATLRTFLEACVPSRLDQRLPALKSTAVAALRRDDVELFDTALAARASLRHSIVLKSVGWDADRLRVSVDVTLVSDGGEPLAMDRFGDDVALPAGLGAPTGPGSTPYVLSPRDRGEGEITIRHRHSGVEWPVESTASATIIDAGESAALGVHVDGAVDPARGFFGRALEPGIWDVYVRMAFLGEYQVRRVPVDAEKALPHEAQQVGGRDMLVYRTRSGNLALKIPVPPPPPVGVATAEWEADDLVIALDIALDAVALDNSKTGVGAVVVVRQRGTATEQQVEVRNGHARIALGHSVHGDIFDFWLRTPIGPDERHDQRLAFGGGLVGKHPTYRIYGTEHGSFSVKHVGPSGPTGPPPAPAPTSRARGWLSRLGGSS